MFASTLDGRYQTVGDIQCPFYLSTVSRAVGLRVFSIRRTFNKRIGISGTNIPTWLAEPHCSSVSWAQGGQHRIVALPVFLLARFIHVVLVGDFMALQAGFPGMPNSLPNGLMFISRKIAGMVKWGFSMELFFSIFLAFKDSRKPSDKSPDWLTWCERALAHQSAQSCQDCT